MRFSPDSTYLLSIRGPIRFPQNISSIYLLMLPPLKPPPMFSNVRVMDNCWRGQLAKWEMNRGEQSPEVRTHSRRLTGLCCAGNTTHSNVQRKSNTMNVQWFSFSLKPYSVTMAIVNCNLCQHFVSSYRVNFKGNSTSTILDKHDNFITGFEHSCSLQQAEAEVKRTLQATTLLILFNCTSHVWCKIGGYLGVCL